MCEPLHPKKLERLNQRPEGGPDNDFDILGARKQLTNAENFNAYAEIDSSVQPA